MTLMSRNKHNPTEEDKSCLLTLTTEHYIAVYTVIFKVQHFIYNVDYCLCETESYIGALNNWSHMETLSLSAQT